MRRAAVGLEPMSEKKPAALQGGMFCGRNNRTANARKKHG